MFKDFRFQPTLIPTVVFILLLPLLLSLGVWQLNRAKLKQDWQSAMASGESLSLTQALQHPAASHFRPITLTGHFLAEPTLLLMHQQFKGEVGYHVFNVFVPEIASPARNDEDGLLVNRGFINRDKLADLPPPPLNTITIHGIIDLPKPKQFILGDNIASPAERPLRFQRLDTAELSAVLDLSLLPVIVKLESDTQDGLVRDWVITPSMPPAKHLGYAIQWFALALCLCVIYVAVNTKRIK